MNINKELIKVGTFLADSDVLYTSSEKIIANFIWYVAKKLNYTKQIINLEDEMLANPLSWDATGTRLDDTEILYELNAVLEQVAIGNR